MNFQQLRDILTIAREGSITKASHILFKAQPNLSSMIREVESELNITIFKRTQNGVVLTAQGEKFVSHAAEILAQAEKLEQICREPSQALSMGISVCRASYCVRAVSDWMNENLSDISSLSLRLCETNTDEAIEQVFSGVSSLGIIRLPSFYENYYRQQLENKNLCCQTLMEFTMMLIFHKSHPFASLSVISQQDLYKYTEIVHGDQQNLAVSMARINPLLKGAAKRRVYVYDRGSQIDLLQRLPDAYMWVSPIPLDMVDSYDMKIRSSDLSTVVNSDLMIYRKDALSDERLKSCADFLKDYAVKLKKETVLRLKSQENI